MRTAYLALALSGLIVVVAAPGCGNRTGLSTWGEDSQDERTRLAAYAASRKYPATQPTDQPMRMTAIVDRRAGMIRIINPTGDPGTDVSVWVNRNFVARVDRIPAQGIIELDMDRFYNGQGQSLPDARAVVREVQVQRGGQLQNLLGPVFDS